MINYNKLEFGDYQTPLYFTEYVCKYLKEHIGVADVIIEPTCGIGNFLTSAGKIFKNAELYGIEINSKYINQIKSRNDSNMHIFNENIFDFDFSKIINNGNSYFVIGNPPWVTNSVLSSINSSNLPDKSNFKKNNRLNSLLGDSNFDISESIILKIIEAFKNEKTTIAMLCKLSVAISVFKEIKRKKINVSMVKNIKFDSKKVFGVNASSCILIIQLSDKCYNNADYCGVYDIGNPIKIQTRYGYVNDKFYRNIDKSFDIDRTSPLEYRQGLKHDCAKVMELEKGNGFYKNKNGDSIRLEDTFIYPLLKSSNLKQPIIRDTNRYVVVTQKKLHEDTSHIKDAAPPTWQYLEDNIEYFKNRRSKIYKNSHKFSIFGIGDYSFAKYKVAISGFNKEGLFCLVSMDKPAMLDDTCYYLSFDDYDTAYIAMLILNSDLVGDFLKSIVFLEAKRPYTKKILKRIDLNKCIEILTLDNLKSVETKLNIPPYINKEKYGHFKKFPANKSKQTKLPF